MNPVSSNGLLRSLVMFGTERRRCWEKGERVAYQEAFAVARLELLEDHTGAAYIPPPATVSTMSSRKDVERILTNESSMGFAGPTDPAGA